MTNLRVCTEAGELCLSVAIGQTVREVLDTSEVRVRAACGGASSCGACVVRLLRGEVNSPTLSEYHKLTVGEREQGLRLACQLRLMGDAAIFLDDPAPASRWKSISPENLMPAAGCLPELKFRVYGLAVDIGTTHIRVALWDRKRGKRIATRIGVNPQGVFGADVLNRLDAACARPERAEEISRLARDAIIQAVRDILARDVGEVIPMLAEIGHVIIVGNTAMLALLTQKGGKALLDPENWQLPIDCQPCSPEAWRSLWPMPNAVIEMPESLAGFVGSDLSADLIATRLIDGPAGAMLLDVGTNSEIALWDGQRLHVTSVPGGPAFEGAGIRFGMPAEIGAICRVLPPASIEGGPFLFETIGDADARGFCGSGLVDAVALLLADGRLKPSGRFAVEPGVEGFLLDPSNPRTAISGRDVDVFQRAKAAVAAAMDELLHLAEMRWPDLQRLCICGAFGRTLNIAHAQAVGLLPPIDPACVELMADAALSGCERALLSLESRQLFADVREKIQVINLSLVERYDVTYIRHLTLKQISRDDEDMNNAG